MSKDLTRRAFVGKASIYGSSLSLAMMTHLPLAEAAAAKSQSPEALTESEWCAVQAITGRIIPSGDSPGAIEANCVNFIDKALAHEEKAALSMLRKNLAALDRHCLTTWKKVFCKLGSTDQDTLLMALEDERVQNWPPDAGDSAQFFGFIRALTIMGFLADPKYGGNRNFSGWQVAGYPGPRHHRGGYSDAQMIGKEAIKPVWDA
jgi:gluconate 2-dehydrogenase gamma chain